MCELPKRSDGYSGGDTDAVGWTDRCQEGELLTSTYKKNVDRKRR